MSASSSLEEEYWGGVARSPKVSSLQDLSAAAAGIEFKHPSPLAIGTPIGTYAVGFTTDSSEKNPTEDPEDSVGTDKKHEGNTTFMFPAWHPEVAEAVFPYVGCVAFHHENTVENVVKHYSDKILAEFTCNNADCSQAGESHTGNAIIIMSQYVGNTYNAVVYNKQCMTCEVYGELTLLKDTYVECVVDWLKQWGVGATSGTSTYGRKKEPPVEYDMRHRGSPRKYDDQGSSESYFLESYDFKLC